ncbi:transposase [Virgibacillus pantothenticus]|uniref:transposase n=1 Tax=Virgibacillus pantothenticus TaxID=1473 RepID=UPI001C24A270|nr:transposase [Virgibacillus pantothenticus]MBU8567820.1 transposase [Virgibacillus pantothenticus]MBU8601613.1 transposase [Virgibacillus pantothenticus]MBU8635920.1 transposase [Virgibacillus pantothenticus]MBU8641364.1 transposase [Virgibacillus pantothenticus]MBU8646183.1 transposase [Virgibacillus pantothenticus]
MDKWTQNFPELGQAYELKVQFFDIYDINETELTNDANKFYQSWLSNIRKELMTYFEDLIKTTLYPITQFYYELVSYISSYSL